MTEHPIWIPDELWPELFANEALVRRAERWLSEAPLPNPRIFVRGHIESWPDAAVLASTLFRRGHQGCIDQAVWVATIGVPAAVVDLFKRDLPHRWFNRLHEEFVGLGDAVYTSPMLACWAPWLTPDGEAQTYISLDHMGQPVEVTRYPLVASVMTRDEDEDPKEPTAWSPAPVLRSALGIVSAVGDRHLRQYVDRSYRPVAIEWDAPHIVSDLRNEYGRVCRKGLYKPLQRSWVRRGCDVCPSTPASRTSSLTTASLCDEKTPGDSGQERPSAVS